MKQYYDLLEIDESLSKDEVKKAFLSKKASLQSKLLSKDSYERQDAMRNLQELTQAYKEIITSLNNKKAEVKEQESGSTTHDIHTDNTKQDRQDKEDTSKITHGNNGSVASVDEKVGQKNEDGNIGTNSNSGTVTVSPKPNDETHIADNVLICPKCKFANNATLKFCGNCGQPLRNNGEDGSGNSGDNGVVTTIVKYKNYIFSVLAILLILVCGIGVFKNFVNTPEKAVEKYLTALGKQDYAAAYGYLLVTENDFVNKDNYIKSIEFMKKNPNDYKDKLVVKLSKGIADINVVQVGQEIKVDAQHVCTYKYKLRLNDNSEVEGTVAAVSPASYWDKLLGNYKIPDHETISLVNIEVETNAKLYVDGVLLKSPNTTKRGTHEYGYDLFYGEHNIKVEAPFCNPYETKLILTPNTKSPVLYYWKSHLKKDVLQDMEKQSEDIQRKIVEGAVKNESLENLQLGFSEAKLSNMYDQYKRFFNRADGSGIYSMDITEITSNEQYNNRLYNPFKDRIYKINFKFNYTRKNRNGIQESRVGNGEGELGVVFKLENDKVVPVAIDTFRLRTH
ncbi:MAG: hypothetical protein ACM690_03090 [Phascolarctobacterium sp.]|uniref:hypothetical protein n=1 Tax=Phascolarctobacterium sp. TaxID=2049039 RepID=UPI003A100EA4